MANIEGEVKDLWGEYEGFPSSFGDWEAGTGKKSEILRAVEAFFCTFVCLLARPSTLLMVLS